MVYSHGINKNTKIEKKGNSKRFGGQGARGVVAMSLSVVNDDDVTNIQFFFIWFGTISTNASIFLDDDSLHYASRAKHLGSQATKRNCNEFQGLKHTWPWRLVVLLRQQSIAKMSPTISHCIYLQKTLYNFPPHTRLLWSPTLSQGRLFFYVQA